MAPIDIDHALSKLELEEKVELLSGNNSHISHNRQLTD